MPFLCLSRHCRIKSSPLQSAPSRFSASLFSAKQDGSNPLPLVSWRFRLCSALPSRFGGIRFDASPWLLIAFHTQPRLVRSDLCASAGRVSNSAHFAPVQSQPLLISAMPIWANRFSSAPSRYISSPSRSNPLPFDANQIRADHLRSKSGLRTSNPCQFSTACVDQCRACSLPFRSIRHSAVSSLLFVHPVEASQSHRSSLVRQSDLSCSPPFRFVGIRRAAFPFHFAVTQGCALPWQCHSHQCRFIASPYDTVHCCAAPSPRFACQVYSMP